MFGAFFGYRLNVFFFLLFILPILKSMRNVDETQQKRQQCKKEKQKLHDKFNKRRHKKTYNETIQERNSAQKNHHIYSKLNAKIG